MPRISEFYGIEIYLYYRDHAPPHFHAIHGSEQASIVIATGSVLRGRLSPRALALVTEWCRLNQTALEQNWERARQQRPLHRIGPLD